MKERSRWALEGLAKLASIFWDTRCAQGEREWDRAVQAWKWGNKCEGKLIKHIEGSEQRGAQYQGTKRVSNGCRANK